MINVNINGKAYQFGENLTILQACQQVGIKIPTLCYLKDLAPSGSCRMCVVELEGAKTLVTSCAYPLNDGMVIKTNTARIREARKMIVELLIANHPNDCLHCNKSMTCELQKLAEELGAETKPHYTKKRKYKIDTSSPSIIRDPNKCIICGRCVRVCEEIQSVGCIDFTKRGFESIVLPAFNDNIASTTCVNCGQCIKVCPTGALTESYNLRDVTDALHDPDIVTVAQIAPSVRVALGELYNIKNENIAPLLVDALKRIGFDYVFDTNFGADLTIMEEGTELVERINNKGVLPMITSCSPGWIKFIEHFFPSLLPNLSTCKSPQQMEGAMIKSFWAKNVGIDPAKVHCISIMPCTAKKFEALRPEMEVDGIRDVDTVITTREVAKLLNAFDLKLSICEERDFDNPLGESTGAGMIFGASGGVAEAALRTVHKLLTGSDIGNIDFISLRGMKGIKEASVKFGDTTLFVAICSGLGNARKLLEKVVSGEKFYHFIEIMACPGGCMNGGGQPVDIEFSRLQERMEKIYTIDKNTKYRRSHENPSIKKLYDKFLEKPNSEKAHKYLHTNYVNRDCED
ncbi:MAG: iron hydrogenase small subunit [Deltaproteobacteria bacterium]|nr:iron hydrogenase small subunit [Deltaproteobacteria bacterium]